MENKITTVIVDDEINARENLRYLLATFCPNIAIVGEAKNVDDAVILIEKTKPQLVFLDIEMPQKNGFQLLEIIKEINFRVIFVTAYDQYAIKAFKVSAVDYLMKPIDIHFLENAVKKATRLIEINKPNENLSVLIENSRKIRKIAIPYKSDYVIIDIKKIACIQADRMYSVIRLTDGKNYTASKKLSYYEDAFSDNDTFIRLHRSWLVNSDFIHIYSKKDKNIELTNGTKVPLSKGYKEGFEELFNKS